MVSSHLSPMIFKHMKLLTFLAIPLAFSPVNAQSSTTTTPVGVVKITIDAAAAVGQPTYSYLSTSMSAEMVYQGTVTAGGAGTITIGNNDWTANQFATVPYYLIVASGPREGEILDITSNTENTLTLAVTDDQSDLIGESIRIHKHNTIASIFGNDPAAGTVQKGDQNTADQILLYNSLTGSYDAYYYNTVATSGPPFNNPLHIGWVKAGERTIDAANTPISPDDGFIYKRVSTSSYTVNVNGTVITNAIKVPIIPGYNLVTIPYPVDKSITLATSNLADDLQAGNQNTADQVLLYNSGLMR